MSDLPDPTPRWWDGLACSHTEHEEPDELGDALCFRCEARVRVKFTEAGFAEDWRRLMKQLDS